MKLWRVSDSRLLTLIHLPSEIHRKIILVGSCWVWTGEIRPSGHGRVWWEDEHRAATAVVWELTHGPIYSSYFLLHTCDVPPCVNPDHLYLGTDQNNSDDRLARGRVPRGERNGKAKLTDEKVREIRKLSILGWSDREISRSLKISHMTIGRVLRRGGWSHVQ